MFVRACVKLKRDCKYPLVCQTWLKDAKTAPAPFYYRGTFHHINTFHRTGTFYRIGNSPSRRNHQFVPISHHIGTRLNIVRHNPSLAWLMAKEVGRQGKI